MGHFQRDCKYDGDKPADGQQEQKGPFDSYEPVCRKVDNQFSGPLPLLLQRLRKVCMLN